MQTFQTSRLFIQTPEAVFAAISDPVRLARWWGPSGFTNAFEIFEFVEGGRWVFDMIAPDGTRYPNESVFTHIEPERQVVMEHVCEPLFRLTITLDGCRYNPENPAAEAYAHLTVRDANMSEPVFDGWMVASSPALSALDHPRYDVWVLRCDVPDLELPDVEPAPEDGGAGEGDPPATDDGNG